MRTCFLCSISLPTSKLRWCFLGYGLQVPEKNHDDFADFDLKGKVAVTIPLFPRELTVPSPSMPRRSACSNFGRRVSLAGSFWHRHPTTGQPWLPVPPSRR